MNIKFKKEGELSGDVCLNGINNYYCTMGFADGEDISDTVDTNVKATLGSGEFWVTNVSKKDLFKAWKALRKKLSKNDDTTGLSKYFLDQVLPHPLVNEKLLEIIESFFIRGIVPKCLKLSRVVPIPKISNASIPSDFRPISLTPNILLLMEKIYYNFLIRYLDINDIIYPYQFGCRNGHFTEVAMLVTTDYVKKAVDMGNFAVIVSIDMRKAFDSVHRELLLQKLKHRYKISDYWLRSYLNDRKQYVQLEDKQSSINDVLIGTPAGSILGGILFALFINDMPEVVKNGKVTMFVDDSNLIFVGALNDLESLQDQVASDMMNVNAYFKRNLLTINNDKTKMITISSNRKVSVLDDFSFLFEGFVVTNSKTLKCLGLTFDRTLSWATHISNAAKICFIRLRALYTIRDLLTVQQLKMLGNALILSVSNYMLVVVGATEEKHIKSLNKVVRALARLILRVKKFEKVANRIHSELKWLFPKQLYEYRIICLMYKLVKEKTIPCLQNYFVDVQSIHNYSTRSNGKLAYRYRPRLEVGKNVFQYNGVLMWNSLPESLRVVEKYDSFKKELSKHLLTKCNS